MALRNIILIQNKRTSILVFLLFYFQFSYSQQFITNLDSVFSKVYDLNLSTVNLNITNKPIVIISNKNCNRCVRYFTDNPNKYLYLFILNSHSLLEVNRNINMYYLNAKNAFFTTSDEIKMFKNEVCLNPTPCIINKSKIFAFFDYNTIDKLSEEFSINHKQFLRKITVK